jgi:hypothetical protein
MVCAVCALAGGEANKKIDVSAIQAAIKPRFITFLPHW